jgi:hypothetical protein
MLLITIKITIFRIQIIILNLRDQSLYNNNFLKKIINNNNNNDNCYYIFFFQFSSILNINTFNYNKDNNI